MTKIRLALNKARPALALALAPPLGNAHTDREGKFIIKILRKILKYRTASVPFTVQDEHPDLPPDTPPADAGPDPDPAKDLPLISDEEAAVPGKIVAVVQQEEEEESASGYRIQTTLESPLFLMAFVEPVSAGTAPSQVTPGSTTTLVNTAYSKLKAMSPAEIQKTAEAIDRMWSEEEALAALQGPLGALRALVSLASRDPAFAETVKASLAFVPPPPPVPLGVTASGWPEEPLFVPGPDAGGQVKPTTVRLAATVTMTDLSTGSTVTWSSSAPSIAKVDATGLVSAVADGTASIKATSADGKRSYADSVTVVSGGWIKTEVK
ncbi:MAG: Ig-like domain-containing protein [Candidatus Sericytochromatia bacterium]|nr:Ig-like domain-containing protein [Candidatus Tanganyikabacteria bacterium]